MFNYSILYLMKLSHTNVFLFGLASHEHEEPAQKQKNHDLYWGG